MVFRFGSILIFKEIRFFGFGSIWAKNRTETRMHTHRADTDMKNYPIIVKNDLDSLRLNLSFVTVVYDKLIEGLKSKY